MKSKIHNYQKKLTMCKSSIALVIAVFISITCFAQTGINYKAVITDDLGNIVANQNIDVRFTIEFNDIEFGIITGYREIQNTTTDANGIIVLNIGEGTVLFGSFPESSWFDESYLITEIDIETDGTFVSLPTTIINDVPIAKQARFANNANEALYASTANFANTAAIANNVSGLEQITEGNMTGWRLIGINPNNYGNIGENAVDLSYSSISSLGAGATGINSTAMGSNNTASGSSSTAMGNGTTASAIGATAIGVNTLASGNTSTAIGRSTNAIGTRSTTMGYLTLAIGNTSTAMGDGTLASGDASTSMGNGTTASGQCSTAIGYVTTAPSRVETVIGSYNTDYIPNSQTNWSSSDRLFVIGNGTSDSERNNALTVLKNGKIGIGRATPSSLLEVAHSNGSPETESLSVLNTDTNNSWQFHTTSYLNLYRNGVFKGSWNATSGAYVQASDRRVKKDIKPIENGTLNKVMQLNPVSYLMKEQTDTKRNLGLISQEVQEIFPSITNYVEESDLLALSYTELIPILIKALQEQQEIIDRQNSKIETITKDLTALKSLETRINQIESLLKTPQQ